MRWARTAAASALFLAAAACGDGGSGSAGGPASGSGGAAATGGAGGVGGEGAGGQATGGAPASGGGGSGGDPACAPPTDGLYATFDVNGETFSSAITNAAGIQQAIDLWHGTSNAGIPNGQLRCSPAPYNCPWSFHHDPATLEFAEVTIEVCDGLPSYVDAHCASFGANFCPWSAMLVDLRDCRTDPGCPVVP